MDSRIKNLQDIVNLRAKKKAQDRMQKICQSIYEEEKRS